MYETVRAHRRAATHPEATVCLVCSPPERASDDEEIDAALGGRIAEVVQRAEVRGEPGEVTHVDSGGRRVLLLGLGDRNRLDSQGVRAAALPLLRVLHRMGVGRVRVSANNTVVETVGEEAFGRALGEGLGLAKFSFDRYKRTAKERAGTRTLSVATGRGEVDRAVRGGLQTAEAANFARELAATPPNVAHPGYIAERAQRLAKANGLRCRVFRGAELDRQQFVGLKAVGGAAANGPCLIELTYEPGRATRRGPVVLAGKTITFDSGGLSVKPPASMRQMKYDKCGGMAVLGAMAAVAKHKPRCRVVGLLPAAENAIDASAYRVDDILEYPNGLSVEVTNTDAEGRLVLADALIRACRQLEPEAVIDLATLTGSIVTALGQGTAGLWCEDATLRERIEAASAATGERVWRMPLLEEHEQSLESTHADVVNAPTRPAGSPCTAAAFLSQFVDHGVPWAHIDMAGAAVAWSEQPPFVTGPTGFGTRLLSSLLETWA